MPSPTASCPAAAGEAPVGVTDRCDFALCALADLRNSNSSSSESESVRGRAEMFKRAAPPVPVPVEGAATRPPLAAGATPVEGCGTCARVAGRVCGNESPTSESVSESVVTSPSSCGHTHDEHNARAGNKAQVSTARTNGHTSYQDGVSEGWTTRKHSRQLSCGVHLLQLT